VINAVTTGKTESTIFHFIGLFTAMEFINYGIGTCLPLLKCTTKVWCNLACLTGWAGDGCGRAEGAKTPTGELQKEPILLGHVSVPY
jgi:hypothetical protein